MRISEQQAHLKTLADAAYRDLNEGRIGLKAFNAKMDDLEQQDAKLKSHRYAKKLAADCAPENRYAQRDFGGKRKSLSVSPFHVSDEQWHDLWVASKKGLSGFRVEIGAKDMASIDGGGRIFSKDTLSGPIAEGDVGANFDLLPPTVRPEYTVDLPLEPDRLSDHFIGAAMDSPSVEFLVHSGNELLPSEMATAELGEKQDLGMTLDKEIVMPTKIAALQRISNEALNDWSYFRAWVPTELQRAIINAETYEIVNGDGSAPHMKGLLHTDNVLTRDIGSDTPLDAVQLSIDDLRVGAAYATADTAAFHPTTWNYLRRQKDDLHRYLLSPLPSEDQVSSLWGLDIVQNTMIPVGTGIIFDSRLAVRFWTRQALSIEVNWFGDTEWRYNAVSYRCEERVCIGVQRPKALLVLTGLADITPGS
jgi:capsid protein